MKTLLVFIIMGTLSYATASGQATNLEVNDIRLQYRSGISIQAGSPVVLGWSYDHFINTQINVEIIGTYFGGSFWGLGAGLKFHIKKADSELKWSPYIGLNYSRLHILFFTESDYNIFYVPIGIQYYSKGGITVSVEAAYLEGQDEDGDGLGTKIWGGLKIGYRW